MVFAKDFELPGFPTTNNGIRSSTQITIINTFSHKALFRAMLPLSSNSFKNISWQLKMKMHEL